MLRRKSLETSDLKILIVVAFALLLFGCDGMPKKPSVEMCFPDVPKNECICGMTEGEKVETLRQLVLTEVVRKPMSYCDKATSFPPKEWEKIKNYIDELEEWGKEKCK